MKKGWQKKRLGDVTTKIGSGATPRGGDESYKAEGISLIRSLNVYDDGFREAKLARIDNEQADGLSNVVVEPHDVLLNITGASVARCCRAPADFLPARVNQHVSIIRPVQEKLDSDFLHYLLISKTYKDRLLHTGEEGGSTRQAITKAQLQEFVVEFPESLAEQQRIVGLLDEAFEGLATAKTNAEKNLQNARALFESHLQSVFTQRGSGWVEKPLGDLCDFLNGFAFKSGDALAESQTQLVRMGNLYGNQLDLDRSPVFYPDGFATEHSRYVLEEGDIIMSLTGTTGKEDYGFAVRIPDCGLTLLMNQRIMKFDALKRDIIDDGYLLHYLRSRCFLDVLYPTANGTRQANLSSVTIKLLPVPLRSLKEQKAIATKLDDLREEPQRLARIYERNLAALAELKKSLLHQAFTGEL